MEKTYPRVKVYFVELDDEDRERVLSGVLDNVRISTEEEYGDIMTGYDMHPVSRFVTQTRYKLEETYFVPNEDGTVLKYENFSEMEDEEE